MSLQLQSDELGKLTLRLTVGLLMLFHGVHKILNPSSLDFISKKIASFDLPQALAYGVYLGELIAPLMIILGIFARFGGLLVVGNMIIAIALAHHNQLFTLTNTGGWALELQIFFFLTGLSVFFLGSGRIAVKPD